MQIKQITIEFEQKKIKQVFKKIFLAKIKTIIEHQISLYKHLIFFV